MRYHLHALGEEDERMMASEHVKNLKSDTKTLERIVDCLVQYSNIGKQPLRIEAVDLGQLIKHLAARYEPKKGEILFEPHQPKLLTDPVGLGFVLEALIENGLTFNNSRRKSIEIGTLEGEAGRVILYVRDNGLGIAKEHGQTIFKIFKQLHRKDEYQRGFGVGLAFSKRIIEKLGGQIWVESEKGAGSTFFMDLPLSLEKPPKKGQQGLEEKRGFLS